MRIKSIYILGVIFLLIIGCKKEWDMHYNNSSQAVNQNVWEAMQTDEQISRFVQIIKESKLDTLFKSDIPYTVIAPTNSAIDDYIGSGSFNLTVEKYHLCSHFINASSIKGKRQVQTLAKKFAIFEIDGNVIKIDGRNVDYQSPLFRNGRYFKIDQVLQPKPNLYEYFALTNPVLTAYIDEQDTVILDKEKSKPLGFDENGNTIYDTVSTIENKFEWEYFPVKHEFRSLAATIVFPKEEDYQFALNRMAETLGGTYQDYHDIPMDWQNKILMPYLLRQGIFYHKIEPEEFIWDSPKDTVKLLNVLGDSIVITYVPTDKAICSNGYAYNYQNFEIPDSLYNGKNKYEGEKLLIQSGLNQYYWADFVEAHSSSPMAPLKERILSASNDSILRVPFPADYNGSFSVEFPGPRLFPRKYVMVVRTHMDIGGIYDIYVNDELVRTFDYYDYVLYRGVLPSVTGSRFRPNGRFNSFDMYVNNITQYGKPKIRFEYMAPGNVLSNGLVIDYIDFVAVE